MGRWLPPVLLMEKKSRGRGNAAAKEAPVEVVEREAPTAAADSGKPRKQGDGEGRHRG